jgi:hypothetical protein
VYLWYCRSRFGTGECICDITGQNSEQVRVSVTLQVKIPNKCVYLWHYRVVFGERLFRFPIRTLVTWSRDFVINTIALVTFLGRTRFIQRSFPSKSFPILQWITETFLATSWRHCHKTYHDIETGLNLSRWSLAAALVSLSTFVYGHYEAELRSSRLHGLAEGGASPGCKCASQHLWILPHCREVSENRFHRKINQHVQANTNMAREHTCEHYYHAQSRMLLIPQFFRTVQNSTKYRFEFVPVWN